MPAAVEGHVFTMNADGVPEWMEPEAGTGGATDPEVVRDTAAAALVAGAGIVITPNDPADTITVAANLRAAQGSVDFGSTPSDYAEVVIAATWVTSSHRVIPTVRGGTADHALADEDAAIEELRAVLVDVVDATSITVGVHAPHTTTGQYLVDVLGAA
jgi:hypothetical protein